VAAHDAAAMSANGGADFSPAHTPIAGVGKYVPSSTAPSDLRA